VKRRSSRPKEWIPITSSDGLHRGEYEASDDMMTVRSSGRQKSAHAPSSRVPATYLAETNESLAKLILSELTNEGGDEG